MVRAFSPRLPFSLMLAAATLLAGTARADASPAGDTCLLAAAPRPTTSALADINRDGRVDHVAWSPPSSTVVLRLSGVAEPIRLAVRASVSRIGVADVDDDGDVDLLALTTGGRLLVFSNDGHHRFRAAKQRPTFRSTVLIVAASESDRARAATRRAGSSSPALWQARVFAIVAGVVPPSETAPVVTGRLPLAARAPPSLA